VTLERRSGRGSWRCRRMGIAALLGLGGFFLAEPALAQGGHGPSFGLATPTGGRGSISYDLTSMSFLQDGGGVMLRHTWRYSPTERIMLNISFPTPLVRHTQPPPRTRGGTLMPGFGDLELTALWRFHQQNLGVGSRFESTAIVGAAHTGEDRRGGVRVGQSLHAAAVTGYASRTVYFWVGGGAHVPRARGHDRLGTLSYVSAVAGWRPPLFRGDYPRPDWRIFIEGISERAGRDRVDGELVGASGGHKLLVGPSLLGLYGPWGVSVGLLVPVSEDLNDPSWNEPARLMTNFSYWF
jgi:hypothetical protein